MTAIRLEKRETIPRPALADPPAQLAAPVELPAAGQVVNALLGLLLLILLSGVILHFL